MRYILLSRDTPLLEFDLKGTLVEAIKIIGNTQLLPEILKTGKEAALQHWLSTRGIDTTRTNARMLLKELKLKSDRVSAVIYNRGLNMTDCYWIKDMQKDHEASFSEISLYRKENIRSISALSISGRAVNVPSIQNHEITNIGSFNKAWVKEDDEWWLYKGGNLYNNYAELFTYYLGKKLNFNMAKYKFASNHHLTDRGPLIASLNFTNEDCMLEHYDSFRYRFEEVELSDDDMILENMKSVGLEKEYINMLILDALVVNIDRHEFNFGLLKSTTTGELIGFAPYFDHNLSLNAHLNSSETIGLGQYKFCKKVVGNKNLQDILQRITINEIKEIDKQVREELETNGDFNFVIDYLKKLLEEVLD